MENKAMVSGDEPTPPPTRETVVIEHDGKTYEGTYTIGGGSIRVSYGSNSTATEFQGLYEKPLPLARTILREMVTEQGQKQKRATYVNLRISSVDDYWNAMPWWRCGMFSIGHGTRRTTAGTRAAM